MVQVAQPQGFLLGTLFSDAELSNDVLPNDVLSQTGLAADIADLPIQGLCLDSRRVLKGQVFIALRGAVHDGRQFILPAIEAGAVAVLADSEKQTIGVSWHNTCPVIEVPQLARQLSKMAGVFYGSPSQQLRVVGVTGTNGKTTCTHLIAQLETMLGNCAASVGTLGYGLAANDTLTDTGMTTPDAIVAQGILAELVQQGANTVAMEVSSHSLSQQRVAGIAFDVGVFTNLTRDHLDYHGDMESYARAKQALFELQGLKHAVLSIDDAFGRQFYRQLSTPQLWSYSVSNHSADVHTRDVSFTQQGIEAVILSPWGKGKINSSLMGEFNLSNLLATLTVACVQGADFQRVLTCMQQLQPVAGRMERINMPSDISLVVDYAHTPDALQQALSALRHHSAGKLHCVFGCGGDRDKGKRSLMGEIAEENADKVLVTSDNPRSERPLAIIDDILTGIKRPEMVVVEADRATAIAMAVAGAEAGDCVLIAGKGHEDYQLVGAQRLSFSDREQARTALRERMDEERENHTSSEGKSVLKNMKKQ